jgi:hypothetical protein
VLFESRFWPLIADGSVTVTFRRWRRLQVKVGGRYRTPGGMIAVDGIDRVEPAAIRDDEARSSGYPSAGALVRDLRGPADLPVYRITFHTLAGPDPRRELAETDALSADDVAELQRRLTRLDRASSHGAWTRATLDAIASRPEVRAGDLATAFGRETLPFKTDVRKLKNLGLTISLKVGYRLSPRGAAYLKLTQRRSGGAR